MTYLTIGVGQKAKRINSAEIVKIYRHSENLPGGGSVRGVCVVLTTDAPQMHPMDQSFIADPLGSVLLEWWDNRADILLAEPLEETMVLKEVWDRIVEENVASAHPFKLQGVGDAMPLERMLSALEYHPEHTFFQAFDIHPRTNEIRAAFYVFRCTHTTPQHYEASIFQSLDDGHYKKDHMACYSLVELAMWMGRCGASGDLLWKIVPLPPGSQP